MKSKTLNKKQQDLFIKLYVEGALHLINENAGYYTESEYDKKGFQRELKALKQMIDIALKEIDCLEEEDIDL